APAPSAGWEPRANRRLPGSGSPPRRTTARSTAAFRLLPPRRDELARARRYSRSPVVSCEGDAWGQEGEMPSIRIPRPWEIPERLVTSQGIYEDRRRFLRQLGFLGAGALGPLWGCRAAPAGEASSGPLLKPATPAPGGDALYPAKRNPAYAVDRPPTDEAT